MFFPVYFATSLICLLSAINSVENIVGKPKMRTNKSKSILPEYYVKEIRPPTNRGKPLEIDINLKVVDINSINVEDMDFRMDMFLRQRWVDSRLHIPNEIFEYGDEYITLPTHVFENLWQPDLYFLNSKIVEVATLTYKFSSVTLYRNKTVTYAARMHAIVACQMEFQYYPMDIQICPLSIESFSYDNLKIKLKWDASGVSISPELKLLQYHIGQPLELDIKDIYTSEKNGNFSRLVVYFRFERQIGHHLIQTFAPSTLVVVLSWFSFWLGLDAIPGRVTLLVTCLLTLVTMFTGLRTDIPPVAYVKDAWTIFLVTYCKLIIQALDLWMAGCMLFVFAALSEFVVVKVLDESYKTCKKLEQRVTPIVNKEHPSIHTNWPNNLNKIDSRQIKRNSIVQVCWKDNVGKEKILWCEIDRLSRIIFPIVFLIFMIIYWPLLILGKSQQYHYV